MHAPPSDALKAVVSRSCTVSTALMWDALTSEQASGMSSSAENSVGTRILVHACMLPKPHSGYAAGSICREVQPAHNGQTPSRRTNALVNAEVCKVCLCQRFCRVDTALHQPFVKAHVHGIIRHNDLSFGMQCALSKRRKRDAEIRSSSFVLHGHAASH
jgi:hypothetical protein